MLDNYVDIKERLTLIEEDISTIKSILSNLSEQNKEFKERLVHIEDKENEYFGIADSLSRENLMDNTNRDIRLHFIRSVDWHNAGDMACNPYDYFPEFCEFHSIIHDWKSIDWKLIGTNDVVILGGGGLLNCSNQLQRVINTLLYKCKHVISWGCGYNTHFGEVIEEKLDFNKFTLFTCRDFVPEHVYCPDVSCMMKELDEPYSIKRNIGVIEHLSYPIMEFEYEKISNRFALNEVIRFIGESEIIITNSWHCAYWGQLMEKKVIIYKPFSDKFYSFKTQPRIYTGDIQLDIEKAVIPKDLLLESRKINIEMKDRVCGLINQITKL